MSKIAKKECERCEEEKDCILTYDFEIVCYDCLEFEIEQLKNQLTIFKRGMNEQ